MPGMNDQLILYSDLLPGCISGYGRLFMTKIPEFITRNMQQYGLQCKNTIFDEWMVFNPLLLNMVPSLDDIFKEYKYGIPIRKARSNIRSEDIHFPEEFKRKNAKSEELRFMIKDTHKENKELDDWFEKQNEDVKALIMQPGPNPYENRDKIPPAEYAYNPHLFPDFDPFIT